MIIYVVVLHERKQNKDTGVEWVEDQVAYIYENSKHALDKMLELNEGHNPDVVQQNANTWFSAEIRRTDDTYSLGV